MLSEEARMRPSTKSDRHCLAGTAGAAVDEHSHIGTPFDVVGSTIDCRIRGRFAIVDFGRRADAARIQAALDDAA